MLKYTIFAIIAAAIGFTVWFYSWTGPQQLNFVDRWYPGSSEAASKAVTAISYGEDERQKLDVYMPSQAATDGAPHKVLVFFHGGAWRDGERAGL